MFIIALIAIAVGAFVMTLGALEGEPALAVLGGVSFVSGWALVILS